MVRQASLYALALACVALGLSTCIQPRPYPEALDPALVEAEIAKAKGIEVAKAQPLPEPPPSTPPKPEASKDTLVAMAEPPKQPTPAAPKAEPPTQPAPPKPVQPKEAPKPEPAKELPKPEPPKEAPKPAPPKDAPKPEAPKEVAPPKPGPAKEATPATPGPAKELAPPTPQPPKEVTPVTTQPPKVEPPEPPAPPKPEPPKEPVPPKPEPSRQPIPPKPDEPKPTEVAKPPAAARKLFLFGPQQRRSFGAGETAELTLVIATEGESPEAQVELTMTDEAGTSWTATGRIGPLAEGRHSLTYGIDVGCFPPGAYKAVARLDNDRSGAIDLVVAPAPAPTTHFRIVGWPAKPPRNEMDALRWSRTLGLNTVLLQDRATWGGAIAPTMDAGYLAASRGVSVSKEAKPLEAAWLPPTAVQTADLLTGAGLEWLTACPIGGQGRPAPEANLADPEAVRSAHLRIHQMLQAEGRFRAFAGLLFTEQALLPGPAAGADSPFAAPAQLDAFKKHFGIEDFAWQRGAQQGEAWQQFMTYRAGLLGQCLASWAAATKALSPSAVATAFLHSPTALADGAYPPLQARGVHAIATTASLMGPAGMMTAAVVSDLQRLGNWDKPLWFMPAVAEDADLDELRAPIFLALARKIEGVIYPRSIDFHLDRPASGQAALELQAGISGVNHLLTRLGDFLLALRKPRGDVAILYSVTEHIDRIGRDPAKDPHAAAYPWTLIAAYNACMFAHFPAGFITEEELLAEPTAAPRVILIIGVQRMRPEVKARLEAHAAAGGVVLTDPTTKAPIEGAKPFAVQFPDIGQYHGELLKKAGEQKLDPTLELRDVVVQTKLLYPLLGPLRNELKAYVERDYTASDPDIIMCDQRCGAGRYVFVVNNTQRPDIFRGLKWELAAGQTKLTFRQGNYVIYEAVQGKREHPMREKGHPTLSVILPPGALRVYALLPEPIRGVRITSASLGRDGLRLGAYVHGDARSFMGAPKRLDAAVPLEIKLSDPSGRERLRLYRAHTPDGYAETIPLPQLAERGTWTLAVRELLSNQSATETFHVSGSAAWARRRGQLAAFRHERLAALLRASAPLSIIVGTDDEAAKAEPLAAALRMRGRTVEVKLAAGLDKPRTLTKEQAATYVPPPPDSAPTPDIRESALLLGDVATNPLLRLVHNSGLLPRTVTPDYPGPGGALLCPVLSAFEPDVEVAVAAAADPAGVDKALAALLATASRGVAPAAAWSALATAKPAVAAKPARPRALPRLEVAWSHRAADLPTCAAVPPDGNDFTVGYYDGVVLGFGRTGKQVWIRRCTTRARAVARSLDGAWAAMASFPELIVVSAMGSFQFAAALEEMYYRADHTALALSLDGTLTVAGTRRGTVLGYDLQGNKVFTVGDKEPEKGKEGAPSRLGPINALSLAPKTSIAVAGGELGTVAIDPKGQEQWFSADLNRVTSLACGLGEEQTVAVGSRSGLVACVSSGTILWRNQADGYVTSVCFRGQTQDVLAASLDGTLVCYDKNGKALWTHRSPLGFRFVASSFDGEVIAASEPSGRVLLLNKAGQAVAETPPLDGAICACTLSFDGQRLLVATAANEVIVFKHSRAVAEQDEL